jgi:hypothetical protein
MEPILPIAHLEDSDPTATPEQFSQAIRLASLGMRHIAISQFFSVPLPCLMQICGSQIRAAARATHQAVLQALHEMALSQRYPAATIFWAKTFCAAILPTPPAAQKPPKPERQQYYQGDTFDFTVYNNDHEPNHDY